MIDDILKFIGYFGISCQSVYHQTLFGHLLGSPWFSPSQADPSKSKVPKAARPMYTAAPTSNAFPPLQRLEWPANELQKSSSSSVDLAYAPRCVNADMPFTQLKITDIT